MFQSEIHIGSAALSLMANPSFAREWADLISQVQWATSYQRHAFADAWYSAYGTSIMPLIITVRDSGNALVGLFAGAQTGRDLIAVGGEQSEYTCWLCRPEFEASVFDEIVSIHEAKLGSCRLSLRYLPPGFPHRDVIERSKYRGRLLTRATPRPHINLSAGTAEASLRKSSNKSKINRLKRLGDLQFQVVDDIGDFERAFDTVIEQYDTRQKTKSGVTPFASDPHKRQFHVEMMQRGLLHVSVLRVGDHIAAAHIGTRGSREVHLSIVSFDKEMENDSPNKILLLMLSKQLAAEGFDSFDLTPSGSSWKWRLANSGDEAQELQLFASAHQRLFEATWRNAKRSLKRLLKSKIDKSAAQAET
jgi:CelD/BcsL family acetyltransferase involved in cellulose biosynthesis